MHYYSLEENLRQSVENHPSVLQQDNAPPHRAAATTQWFKDQGIQVMQYGSLQVVEIWILYK